MNIFLSSSSALFHLLRTQHDGRDGRYAANLRKFEATLKVSAYIEMV